MIDWKKLQTTYSVYIYILEESFWAKEMELCVGEIWGWGLIWRRCLAMHLFPLKDPDDEEEQENRGDAAWIAAGIGAWCFHILHCGAWNPYILNQWMKVWRPWQPHSIRNIRTRGWLKDECFNHQIEEFHDHSRYVFFWRCLSSFWLQLRRPRSGSAGFVAIDPWLVVDSWNQDSQGRWFGSREGPLKISKVWTNMMRVILFLSISWV